MCQLCQLFSKYFSIKNGRKKISFKILEKLFEKKLTHLTQKEIIF